MKTIRNEITRLLFSSLILSIFVSPTLMLLLTNWGGSHGGILVVAMTGLYTIGGFFLSLFAFLNLVAKVRKIRIASLLSFILLPAILDATFFLYKGESSTEETMIIILCISPYLVSMIISYFLFRKFSSAK